MSSGSPTVALIGARSSAGEVAALGTTLERQGLRAKTALVDCASPTASDAKHPGSDLIEGLGEVDVFYLLSPAGKVTVEMSLLAGIAHGLRRPIYVSQSTEDEAIDSIAAGVVPPSKLCPAALGLEIWG